jgi:hypothetical protein
VSTTAKISYYTSAKDFSPTDEITIVDFCRRVRDGATEKGVAHVRAADGEDAKKAAKMKLPAVQLSGHVTTGKRAKAMEEGRFAHSGFIQLDVDRGGLKGKTPEEAKATLASDPHVLSAFISPSGEGAKALFRVKPCESVEEHKAQWECVSAYITEQYGLEIDNSTKDPGRLCYIPSDPQCTWNAGAVEFVAPTDRKSEKSKLENQALIAAPQTTAGSKQFPEPPKGEGVNNWVIRAARYGEQQGWSEDDTRAEIESHAGSLRRSFSEGEVDRAIRKVYDTPSPPKPPTEEERREKLRVAAYALRFNPDETPPPDESCMMIGDVPIAARGNLTVIQGKSKVGKSSVVSAVLGAAQRGITYATGDTLCMSWMGSATGAILHMDTEQSRADWHALVSRSVTRSGMAAVSPRLVSLPLVMFARSERLEILRQSLKHERETCGGVDLVIIDGIADLCKSPNDEAESLELVSQIHAMSQDFECAIFCILHENPSTDQGKTRGHIGSELNRKAFANLRIDKDTETSVSTIYGTDMRKRDIPREQGFCFGWDTEAGMHTFQGRAAGLKAAQRESEAIAKARAEWEPIFEFVADSGTNGPCPALTPKEAAEAERDKSGTGKLTKPETMKKRMQRAETLGVLRKFDLLRWTLTPAGQAGQMRDTVNHYRQ